MRRLLLVLCLLSVARGASAQITLKETDTAATDTAASCNGRTLNAVTTSKQATSGGTLGVTAVSLTHDATATVVAEVFFESAASEPNNTTWAAGAWSVPMEVTTANANLSWNNLDICARNGASNTGVWLTQSGGGISLGTTGVKTQNFTTSGNSTTRSTADRIYLTFQTVSSSTMQTQAWAYKPSQSITTPIVQGGGGGAAAPVPTLTLLGVGPGSGE